MHKENMPPEQQPIQQPMPYPPNMPPNMGPVMPPNMGPNMPPNMGPNMPPAMGPEMKHPCFMPDMEEGAGAYAGMYPEIYHKIQPHVALACDEMEMSGWMVPTKKMLMCMRDRIHENVCKMYPEMEKCPGSWGMPVGAMMADPIGGGPVRDIILVLLLAELFRRRRVY